MEGIQLSVDKKGPRQDISIIKVGGYIDTTTSSELEQSLRRLLKSGSYNIIIDLSNVDYISSAGWGIFISEIKSLREKGGDLKLVGMVPDVYEVFELLEFHYILKAFDTVEEAIRDFDQSAPSGSSSEENIQVAPIGEGAGPETSAGFSQEAVQKAVSSNQSLEDKVRQIVRERPDTSIWDIKRELNSPRFGNQKIGFFALRKLLRRLDLDTRDKRREFFARSSAA